MKYFIIAGEASGDLHASNLMKGILLSDPSASFRFIGGDLMNQVEHSEMIYHYSGMNYMGLFAVLANIRKLSGILKKTKQQISEFSPDAVILVDYAGFNLRMAKFASGAGLKVFYYISPKVWAWRKGRIRSLKKYVDHLFTIFPFETPFFADNGITVEYHGNPLTDAIHAFSDQNSHHDFKKVHGLDDRPIVALLAGSRSQELKMCLPVMTAVAREFPEYQFVVAGAPSCDPEDYACYLGETGINLVFNSTYDLLSNAYAGIITSGTATLEAALFNVPQVVIYKTGWLTYSIGKLFVNLKFFSLVNLLSGRELVKELLQKDLIKRTLLELNGLLNDDTYRVRIMEGYSEIRRSLGEAGASQRAASRMVELLSE